MGNSKSKRLLCHMQVRTVRGRQIGHSKLELYEVSSEMKKICYKSLRDSFDNIVKRYDLQIVMPDDIQLSIKNLDEKFDKYDTQVVIIDVLIHEYQKKVESSFHKIMQFNNTSVLAVRQFMDDEIQRIEKEFQETINIFRSQISLRIEN